MHNSSHIIRILTIITTIVTFCKGKIKNLETFLANENSLKTGKINGKDQDFELVNKSKSLSNQKRKRRDDSDFSENIKFRS